jgi:clan AA aspartic protease (TIGR02281 family)
MRRFLIALGLILFVAAASAASVDPDRIAAIDRAAEAFVAKATEARKTGMIPRLSDPDIGPLLDTVFDTGDLSHGPVPAADFDKLSDWLTRINAVGKIYLSAAREAHDMGLFGAEIGRYYDAALSVLRAMVDGMMAELDAHPGASPSPEDQRKLARLRGSVAGAYGEMIAVFRAPGISVAWAAARLAALRGGAPSMARFLTPAELARLRATIRQQAAALRDKTLRGMLWNLADALATPAPPIAAPAQPSAGGSEIALESDGQGYSVAVRINGALTVKFVVDSGASVVALPSDLVEKLTKSGAIAQSDLLGREFFIAADGRKHKGTRLMLRQLDVGGHTVTNVMANVGPAHVPPLLGQSFLAKFKSWTLDNRRHVLIISE